MNKGPLFLFLLSTLLWSCKPESIGDCFKSTGKTIEESRVIPSFKKLLIRDNINVFIRYSTVRSIQVRAGKNLIDEISTEVNSGTLHIENENNCNWVRSFKREISVFVETPELNEITYYGSGEVNFQNNFVSDTLLVNMWQASGNLHLAFTSQYVEVKSHTGTGTIHCEGQSEEIVAFMGGNGSINTFDVQCKRVFAINENTGLLQVNASDFLKADIKYVGNIEYIGSPGIELLDSGKGELIKR
jgi:hypothetical protein